MAKITSTLTKGDVTNTVEGPKAEFTSATGATLESDGVMKLGGKVGIFQVEIEVDTKKLEH